MCARESLVVYVWFLAHVYVYEYHGLTVTQSMCAITGGLLEWDNQVVLDLAALHSKYWLTGPSTWELSPDVTACVRSA